MWKISLVVTLALINIPSIAMEAAAAQTPRSAEVRGVTQQQTAREILRELDKLRSAVEVGLNFQQYTDRLIDGKSVLDDKLQSLPNDTFKRFSVISLQAFLDAHAVWKIVVEHYNDPHKYFMMLPQTRRMMQKYNVEETAGMNPNEDIGGSRFTNHLLNQIWFSGIQNLNYAKAEVSR